MSAIKKGVPVKVVLKIKKAKKKAVIISPKDNYSKDTERKIKSGKYILAE